MYGKLAVATGFVAGYVLGSKAGRQRYEEIVAQARKVAGNEKVQSTAGVLQAKGTELVGKAKESDIATKVKSTVGRDKSDTPSYESTTSTYGTTPTTTTYDTPATTYEATPTTTYEPTTYEATPETTYESTSTTDLFEPTNPVNGTNNP